MTSMPDDDFWGYDDDTEFDWTGDDPDENYDDHPSELEDLTHEEGPPF